MSIYVGLIELLSQMVIDKTCAIHIQFYMFVRNIRGTFCELDFFSARLRDCSL